jgi:tripartite-type tricarboxylate transporter receptor subunit TctC
MRALIITGLLSLTLICEAQTESWGQQVIVENRPGAGGALAAAVVARAAPNGYTPLSVSSAHASKYVTRVLSNAETRARWSAIGIEPRPTQPGEFDAPVRREVALFSRIARAAQIRAD